jgi:hypothetical protein
MDHREQILYILFSIFKPPNPVEWKAPGVGLAAAIGRVPKSWNARDTRLLPRTFLQRQHSYGGLSGLPIACCGDWAEEYLIWMARLLGHFYWVFSFPLS